MLFEPDAHLVDAGKILLLHDVSDADVQAVAIVKLERTDGGMAVVAADALLADGSTKVVVDHAVHRVAMNLAPWQGCGLYNDGEVAIGIARSASHAKRHYVVASQLARHFERKHVVGTPFRCVYVLEVVVGTRVITGDKKDGRQKDEEQYVETLVQFSGVYCSCF